MTLPDSYHNIGLALRDQGNLAAALDNHKTAQAISKRLVKTDGNTDWQYNLAASHSNIGDLLRAQGNLPAALDSYRAAQAIRQVLLLPIRELSDGGKTSPLLVPTSATCSGSGDLPAALDSYKAAEAIRQLLATIHPGNAAGSAIWP